MTAPPARQRGARPRSIRTRLALGAALQAAIALLIVSAVQFVALRSFLDLSEHERLETLLPGVQDTVNSGLARAGSGTAGEPLPLSTLPGGVDVRVLQGGAVLAQSPDFPPVPRSTAPGYRPEAGHSVLTAPLTVRGRAATAQLASDVLGVLNPLRAYLRTLAVTVPAAATLVALLSFLLAGRLLRPLTRLQQAAARLGQEQNLRAPLPGAERHDEVGALAAALQSSFRQLADAQDRAAAFTRAAAHDLRSPLAALKVRLQGALARSDPRGHAGEAHRGPAASGPADVPALRRELDEALTDVDRMTRLTGHLLLLAAGERARREPLDLAQVVGEVVDRARERAPDTLLEFRARGDTRLDGDPALLATLTENLLGNALRHAPHAEVRIEVERGGDRVRLRVTDGGPGVPEAALPHLCEPFFRVDAARTGEGNGLGLAIVRRVTEAHGGTLSLSNLRPHGLQVDVTLPGA